MINTSQDLKDLLFRINRKSYPAYKDTKGSYRFPDYVLSIDHVQGDPFAAPSKLSLHIKGAQAGFPEALYATREMRIALQDQLIRGFAAHIEKYSFSRQRFRKKRSDLHLKTRTGNPGAFRLHDGCKKTVI